MIDAHFAAIPNLAGTVLAGTVHFKFGTFFAVPSDYLAVLRFQSVIIRQSLKLVLAFGCII